MFFTPFQTLSLSGNAYGNLLKYRLVIGQSSATLLVFLIRKSHIAVAGAWLALNSWFDRVWRWDCPLQARLLQQLHLVESLQDSKAVIVAIFIARYHERFFLCWKKEGNVVENIRTLASTSAFMRRTQNNLYPETGRNRGACTRFSLKIAYKVGSEAPYFLVSQRIFFSVDTCFFFKFSPVRG